MAFVVNTCYQNSICLEDGSFRIKLFAKKEKLSMGKDINGNAEKVKGELKQTGKVVLEWAVTLIYIVLIIYFVFKPLTEFMVMVEYYIKFNIIKYFIN